MSPAGGFPSDIIERFDIQSPALRGEVGEVLAPRNNARIDFVGDIPDNILRMKVSKDAPIGTYAELPSATPETVLRSQLGAEVADRIIAESKTGLTRQRIGEHLENYLAAQKARPGQEPIALLPSATPAHIEKQMLLRGVDQAIVDAFDSGYYGQLTDEFSTMRLAVDYLAKNPVETGNPKSIVARDYLKSKLQDPSIISAIRQYLPSGLWKPSFRGEIIK
jgi:hypothetical protein